MWKLLIADNDRSFSDKLKNMILWSDYDIDLCALADSHEKALEFIKSQQPDIIITEIHPPAVDGLELMKICKEHAEYSLLFIIATTRREFTYAREAVRYGAVDYLLKSELNQEILTDTIQNAIARLKYLKANRHVDAHYIECNNMFTDALSEQNEYLLRTAFEKYYQYIENSALSFNELLYTAHNYLFMAISLLLDSEKPTPNLFDNAHYGYQSLYYLKTVDELLHWLHQFCDNLCTVINKKNSKKSIVADVKKYIESHLEQKFTLNEVAEHFGLSPNYLSSIFKKDCAYSFTKYINMLKINAAQRMMTEEKLKVYEVANRLGYEDAFYFSKVFKKYVGCSPKEYLQNQN